MDKASLAMVDLVVAMTTLATRVVDNLKAMEEARAAAMVALNSNSLVAMATRAMVVALNKVVEWVTLLGLPTLVVVHMEDLAATSLVLLKLLLCMQATLATPACSTMLSNLPKVEAQAATLMRARPSVIISRCTAVEAAVQPQQPLA